MLKSAYNQSSSYQSNVMRKYLFIICTFISVFNLYSQAQKPVRPYEKIQLDGLNPIWYETFYDSSVIDDRLDGYSHFRYISNLDPLVYQDRIYSGYKINDSEGISGGYIECRNLKSGELIWRDRFGLKDGGHVEIPRLMKIEDEKLVVIGQISRMDGINVDVLGGLIDLTLSTRIYNLKDGTLISFKHPEFLDSGILNTKEGPNIHFYFENENFRYLESSYPTATAVIYSYLLNSEGKVISKDSMLNLQIFSNIAQISEDTLLIVELDTASTLKFKYVTPQLKPYYTVGVNYTFNHLMAYIELKYTSIEDRKLLFINKRNEVYPNNYYEVYAFNFDGSLDYKYTLKDKFKGNFSPLNWIKNHGFVLSMNFMKPTSKTSRSFLDVREQMSDSDENILKSFESFDSLRYVWPSWVKKLANGKILLSFKEGSYYVDNHKFVTHDDHAIAFSYMLLDEKDLGITSSTNESTSNATDGLEFFPNPITESLTIRFATPYKGLISLSDISGRTVMVRDVTDLSEEVNIDMSDLATGMYIVRLPHHISGRSYKVVKM